MKVFLICSVGLMFFSLGWLAACDAEWHQNGDLPDWSRISFSESNNPELLPEERPRRRAKIRKKKVKRREKLKRPVDFLEEIPEG